MILHGVFLMYVMLGTFRLDVYSAIGCAINNEIIIVIIDIRLALE
jgi:hypothetical protein